MEMINISHKLFHKMIEQQISPVEVGGFINTETDEIIITKTGDENTIPYEPYLFVPNRYYFHTHPPSGVSYRPPSSADLFMNLAHSVKVGNILIEIVIDRNGIFLYSPKQSSFDKFSEFVKILDDVDKIKVLDMGMQNDSMHRICEVTQDYLDSFFTEEIQREYKKKGFDFAKAINEHYNRFIHLPFDVLFIEFPKSVKGGGKNYYYKYIKYMTKRKKLKIF